MMLKLVPFASSRRQTTYFLVSFRRFLSSPCTRRRSLQPPSPKTLPFPVSAHGVTWNDPYRWMAHTDDPDLPDHLARENSFAEAFMADTKGLQRSLFSEMTRRMPPRISSPPEPWGHWLYYQYIPEGKEYPVLCRRGKRSWLKALQRFVNGEEEETEEVLLDWNQIAEQHGLVYEPVTETRTGLSKTGRAGYVHVGNCRVSPSHNFLAYTIDVTGREEFMLRVKDLRSGCVLPNPLVQGVVSLAWAQDSNTLFYTQSDDNQRPSRALYLKLNSDQTNGVPVFTENDPGFCVDLTSTKDGKFITVNSNSRTSSEEDATNPSGGLRKIHERVPGVQCFLEHHHGLFYLLTNARLENEEYSGESFYLARCPVEDTRPAKWQKVLLPCGDFSIHDMDMFDGFLVLFLNMKGSSAFCSIDLPINVDFEQPLELDNLNPWFFPLPSIPCSAAPGSNNDFMKSVFQVVLSSPVMPDMIVDYDMSRRRFEIVQQEEVKGVSHVEEESAECTKMQEWKDLCSAYCCETKEVISYDGTPVPLTLLYSRTAWQKGRSPGLLQGYGSYGEDLDKSWCSNRLSLLDRGWVVAFADVRGGGGHSSWHKAGSGLNKKNSIHDFVSCANYLVNEDFVQGNQLAGMGQSAGALLLGAAINMNPGLFCAAILKVPFLDVCNTLMDETLPLTVMDYEEFGNPRIKEDFEYIRSYSPYDNISRGSCYPSILVTASLNDTRVGVWEAGKWVAKVRETTCSACSSSVILKTNMNGGHFGEGGRFAECEETAYEYAFLLKAMGMLNQ